MAYDFNGTNQYISASSPVTNLPLTLACWWCPDNASATYTLMSVGNTGLTHRFVLLQDAGVINAQAVGAPVNGTSTHTTPVPVSTWGHAAGVFPSTTSRTAYFNGVAAASDATSSSQTDSTIALIGARYNGSYGLFPDGKIADAAIWNVALTAAEIASLAKGFSPRLIRPQSLVFYAPLVRDLIDVRGGLALTNNNTATVSAHPRIYA